MDFDPYPEYEGLLIQANALDRMVEAQQAMMALNRDLIERLQQALARTANTYTAEVVAGLEARAERAEKDAAHWRANHDNQVARVRVLLERPDLPLERVKAYTQWERMRRGYLRYEALRRVNVAQFHTLYMNSLAGERFDDQVDALVGMA